MKYSINKDKLFPLLSRVNNVIEVKSTQKIRTNILIKAGKDYIELIGFDNESRINAKIPAVIEEQGATTVQSKKLFDVVNALSNKDDICFELVGNNLHLTSGVSKFLLATIPAEEYPIPDEWSFDKSFTLDVASFANMLKRVKFSIGANDARAYLNGALIDFNATNMAIVSSDGHRISVAESENNTEIDDCEIIVPYKTINEIYNWLSSKTGNLNISISATHIQFKHQEIELTSTAINATYPDYKSTMPDISDSVAIIPKKSFTDSLKRIKVLSSEFGAGVILKFTPWSLSLSSGYIDNESAEDKIEINYDGKDIKVSVNIGYILDVLTVIDNENVSISLMDDGNAILIYDNEKEEAKYLVMTMEF